MTSSQSFITGLVAKGWTVDAAGALHAPGLKPDDKPSTVKKADNPKKPNGRRKAAVMNQTEKRFFHYFIEPDLIAGKITEWKFEPLRFNLAEGATYTPDFMVSYKSGKVLFCEVKNKQVWEDSIVKFKWARKEYSCFSFRFFQFIRGKGWSEKLALI